MTMSQESAETVGLQALGWLAGNEDLLPVFLGATGASEADVRSGASDPAFLGGLLDFLMMDDAWVMSFCDSISIPYDRLMQARHSLPGGEQVNWT
jgi:hypothetical protein|tara:strand:- start:71 stop:355 length:285 start_codon:yes stop_codon:yes gene_type:complete